MKKQFSVLLFLLSLAYVTPAKAQSNVEPVQGTYTINWNGKSYEATGKVLTMEFSNLAEDFYMLNLEMDQVAFAEKLEYSWEKAQQRAQELEWKPEHGTKSLKKVAWERKAGSIEIYSDDEMTVLEYDDGEVTVTIVFTNDGPLIVSGESL